ncbi:TPA: hypothetical protein ACQ0FK_001186 [Streptococcus agalactiae]
MKKKNLLQESINKRLSEERYQIPKEKREKKRFDMQLILIISILYFVEKLINKWYCNSITKFIY